MKTKIPENNGSAAALDRLNELYEKYNRAYSLLMAEIDDQFSRKRRTADLASAKFELYRKTLPRTKFDMTSGKYFYAYQDGKEVFDQSKNHSLPAEMERMFPDYSLYPQFDFAVSLTSRGCPRGCSFCH